MPRTERRPRQYLHRPLPGSRLYTARNSGHHRATITVTQDPEGPILMPRRTRALSVVGLVLLMVAALAVGVTPVLAASAPPNDDFAHAQPLTAIPTTFSVDTTNATAQAGEPTSSCANGGGTASVWFSIKRSTANN